MSVNVNGIGNETTKTGKERLKRKIKYIKDLIDENELNLIVLQELKIHHKTDATINVNWKKYFPDFEFYSYDKRETGILVNNKIQHKEIKDLVKRVGENQWTTWVIICNRGGKNIAVASYYRSPSEDGDVNNVTKEVEEIKTKYKTETFMIGGDFNAHSGIWDARFGGNHNQVTENVIKFMNNNKLICANDNRKPTHVRNRDRSSDGIVDILGYNSVDIVLMTQDLIAIYNQWTTNSHNVFDGDIGSENVANCEMDSDWVANMSDHFAMLWKINCKCIEENKRMTWRLNSNNWDDYRQALETYMEIWDKKQMVECRDNDIGAIRQKIDYLTDLMAKSIRAAAKTTIGIKTITNNSKPWMTREIKDLIDIRNKYKSKYDKRKKKGDYNVELKRMYNYLDKMKKKMIRLSKKEVNMKIGSKMCQNIDDAKILYGEYSKVLKKPRDLPPFKKADGSYTDETKEKAEMMHEQFTKDHKENQYNDETKKFHKMIDELIDRLIEQDKINDYDEIDMNIEYLEILNRKISKQELLKAMGSLKKANAMGCDFIHNVMLIEGKEILMERILILYNLILENGYHPFLWKLSEYNGIGKPGKNASILKNIRDLQLTPTLSRIFERIMAWRLLSFFKLNKLFKKYNIAYQGNKSIEDAFLCLDGDMWSMLEGRGILEIIFFDFSKAFDTIWIKGLIYKLRYKYGIKGKFLKWIISFLNDRHNRVKYRGHCTNWKKHKIGLPQGGPISAILFVIYLNDYEPLDKMAIQLIIYADDVNLWNKCYNIQMHQNIQNEITHFNGYSSRWKYIKNFGKTESMCITRKRKYQMEKYTMKDGDTEIEIKQIVNKCNDSENDSKEEKKNNTRILGLYVSCLGGWSDTIGYFNGKCYGVFEKIKIDTIRLGLDAITIFKLSNDIVAQLIRFGIKFYSHETEEKMNKLFKWQYIIAKFALMAMGTTPYESLEYQLDFEPIALVCMKAILNTYESCVRAPDTSLKNQVYQDFKDKRNDDTYDRCRIHDSHYTFLNKSVLSRAWKLKRDINGWNDREKWKQMETIDKKEEKHSLYVYTVEYPPNIIVMYDYDDASKIINNYNSWNWYSDGSIMNENYGGFGYVTMQNRNNNKMISNFGYVNHLTNIDYCEMVAIHACLMETINDCDIICNSEIEYITILTDSMFCLYSMDERYYCKIEYYYNVLQEIFKLCHELNKNGKCVRIVKIPAHKGYTGNEIADYWAKNGAMVAIDMDKNGKISNNDTPLIVQKEINDRKIEKFFYGKRDESKENKREEARKMGRLRVNSNLIGMMNRKGAKYIKNELKRLDRKEAGIIFQLRSEHIELNLYNSIFGNEVDANCDVCNTLETVKHYLIDCEKYRLQRTQLVMELIKINKRFEKEKNVNIISLLFPHTFQGKPYKERQLDDRIRILKLVCDYVLQTKRFFGTKSKVFNKKRRDNYYRLHNSYHKAALAVISTFNVENNINGELGHEDDGFDYQIDEDEFEDESEQDINEMLDEMELNDEFNYDSFVFDRGRNG